MISRLIIAVLMLAAAALPAAADDLPSWAAGPVRTAILAWVEAVTDPGHPDFIPEPERIAVFDNDGTSSCERPANLARGFHRDYLRDMARRGEIDGEAMPLSAWIADDRQALRDFGYREAYDARNAAFAGMEVGAFADSVTAWVARNRHPRFGVPYTELYYRPMAELRELLAAHGFQVWIVTGSTQGVIRAISEAAIGVPPERVIGSFSMMEYRVDEKGTGQVVRAADQVSNTYEAKPAHIENRIGRRPVFAAGNSNNDEPMSRYALTGERRGFALWIHHDDAVREYEYDRSTNRIAALVQQKTDAHEVSIRRDWVRVFPFAGR